MEWEQRMADLEKERSVIQLEYFQLKEEHERILGEKEILSRQMHDTQKVMNELGYEREGMLNEINNLSGKLSELEMDLNQKGIQIDNLATDLEIQSEKTRKMGMLNDELRANLLTYLSLDFFKAVMCTFPSHQESVQP